VEITFLGTGTSQGVPIIACPCEVCQSTDTHNKRLRSSILIEEKGKVFVIDTGPDFRQQMLRENVKQLDAVLFTHEHKDHTAGFDDIRAFNYIQQKEMDVYASQRVQQAIRNDFAYIFSDFKYPGIPEVKLHLLENKLTTIEGVDFLPIEKEKIKGSKVIVVNALRREEHISHFTFEQAIQLMEELKPEKAYFTHISHQLGLHADVEKELPSFISLAYDGLKLQL
jgi:phosphoribosyl 1,2-cyclic phosphate phosphodiesterase